MLAFAIHGLPKTHTGHHAPTPPMSILLILTDFHTHTLVTISSHHLTSTPTSLCLHILSHHLFSHQLVPYHPSRACIHDYQTHCFIPILCSIYQTTCPLNLSQHHSFQNTHSFVSPTTLTFTNESSIRRLEAPVVMIINQTVHQLLGIGSHGFLMS